jgi:hypothetical protein
MRKKERTIAAAISNPFMIIPVKESAPLLAKTRGPSRGFRRVERHRDSGFSHSFFVKKGGKEGGCI